MTPGGLILGSVRSADLAPQSDLGFMGDTGQVVTWTGPGRGTVKVLTATRGYTAAAIDRVGNIYYYNMMSPWLRTPSGALVMLYGPQGPNAGNIARVVSTASGRAYGNGWESVGSGPSSAHGFQWRLATASLGQLFAEQLGYFVFIDRSGQSGDVVGDYPGNRYENQGTRVLLRSTGKAYRLAPQFHFSGNTPEPRVAIDDYGQVMYTAADGLPRLMTCPA